MKIKTSELTGVALDWAVLQCEKDRDDGGLYTHPEHLWSPSTNWAQGGPIIEREQIYWTDNGRTDRAGKPFKWMATKNFSDPLNNFYGPTPLIAALRCYVARSLGDEIEIPDSLGAQP